MSDLSSTHNLSGVYVYVIVPKSSTYKNLADLKGKTAASVLGTMDSLTAHNLADKGAFDQVKDFNTFGEPFVALRNGQVDAVVIDQTTLKGQQDTMGDLRVLAGPYATQLLAEPHIEYMIPLPTVKMSTSFGYCASVGRIR